MSKNMNLDSFCSYEDVRARFKHQTLLQDYMELQQETEAARNNLRSLKQKKRTLQAEVRFLRRRYKYLLENNSSTLQDQVFISPQPTQFRKSKKENVHMEKQITLHNLPFAGKRKTSQRISSPEFDSMLEKQITLHNLPFSGKRKTSQRISSPEFDSMLEDSLYGVKQQSIQRVIANQRVRINGPKASPFLDLSQKDGTFGSQESSGQTRKPVIDLNQISREEEELLEQHEPFEPVMQGLIRKGVNEQHTDVRLSIFGNAGKRKVSWQDPVAVRV